jgi:NAD+ synthase
LLKAELDVSEAKRKIVRFIKEKVETSQSDGVVFELAGGIDSAVSAYLCIEALGTRRVTGLMMPDLRTDTDRDLKDARKIGEEVCLDVKEIDIAPIHKSFMKNLGENGPAEEDLRARIRMALLYHHSNMTNRLVVGTLNKSEMLMGYFTKYGETGADILPIADLHESSVRKLGEVLGINRLVIAKKGHGRPMAGRLLDSEVGVDHDTADRILELLAGQGLDVETIASRTGISRSKVEAVVSRYESSSHKRAAPEICLLD